MQIRSVFKEKKHFYFITSLLLLLVMLTMTKIHGSSIGFYNSIFSFNQKDPNLLFGKLRPIRSDEWMVQAPWVLAQTKNNYAPINLNHATTGIETSLMSVPVKNWTAVFRPQYWPFFILPVENAYSFFWWYKSVILLISLFLITYKLSNNHFLFSSILSVGFLYSPFFQWWYSTYAIELVAYGFLIIYLFCLLVKSQSQTKNFFYVIGICYLTFCFFLLLYPAFQVPILLVIVFFAIGFLLSEQKLPDMWRQKFFIICLGIITILCLIVIFYFSFKIPIQTMQNTIYPGHRFSQGGGLSWTRLIDGFYDFQLLRNNIKLLPAWLNECEASSFFLFSIFLIPVILLDEFVRYKHLKKIDMLIFCLMFLQIILIVWSIWKLPLWLSKILFLELTVPVRSLIGLGMLNILIIIRYMTNGYQAETNYGKRLLWIFSVCVFFLFLWFGCYLINSSPDFIQSYLKIIITALFVGFCFLLILYKQKLLFSLLFTVFSLFSSFYVNPIYRGLSPVFDTPFSKGIAAMNETYQSKWLVYGDIPYSNVIFANGGHVFSGTFYYPDFLFFHTLDTKQENMDIYNRYSHVVFTQKVNNDSEIQFNLHSLDVVEVSISPCNLSLEKMGINTFVFMEPVEYSCLIQEKKINNVYIYRRKYKAE